MPFSHYTGRRKVVVVGAGAVGSTFCYALCQRGLADEIALIDTNTALARQVIDELLSVKFGYRNNTAMTDIAGRFP